MVKSKKHMSKKKGGKMIFCLFFILINLKFIKIIIRHCRVCMKKLFIFNQNKFGSILN